MDTHTSLDTLCNQLQSIRSLDDLSDFKHCMSQCYEWLDERFDHDKIDDLLKGRTQFIDTLIVHSWTLCQFDNQAFSLLAVGGYGRGFLQPYSDIDLLILCKSAVNDKQHQQLSRWITFLWDVGLDIGHSVRTIKQTLEHGKQDIQIATNLVESRRLIGSESLFEKLQDKVYGKQFWPSQTFFLGKFEEQEQRHKKFNNTAYNLEPNLKENPGCLRDMQTIGWVAKMHFKVINVKNLIGLHYFTDEEYQEMLECRDTLWKMRCALHLHTRKNENRLLFDHQSDVAKRLGFGDDGKASVEKMMKAFYRVVSRVIELNEVLLQHFRQEILSEKVRVNQSLNQDFELHDGLIFAKHDQVFEQPEDLLKFFWLIADTPDVQGLHSNALRLLRNARRQLRAKGQYLSEFPACRQWFMKLVTHPNCFKLAWNLMHHHGIMQAYIQQWDNIVGLMQFDLFHAYTVDEHTHKLIKNLEHYRSDEPTEFPRCRHIVKQLDKPELLFIAGIFHDIAKGRNGDHSVLGAEDIAQFCDSHDIAEADKALLIWLVKNHLLMSVVAQRRDIHDPDVVNEFVSNIRDKNYLNHLYALTLADIRATNDNLWNEWKSTLLKELYILSRRVLDNGLVSQFDRTQTVADNQHVALELLKNSGITADQIHTLWNKLDDNYFIRFKGKQLAWHAQQIMSANCQGDDCLVIELSDTTSRSGTEVLIYAKDRLNLFAQVAGVLDSRNCLIHDANIMTMGDGYVLDTFIILDQDDNRISSQSRLTSLKQALFEQLSKPGTECKNSRKLSRQLKQFDVQTKLRFFTNQSGLTLLELESLDKPGLLAQISEQFVLLNIALHKAKISTIGERAEDLFILTNAQGDALTPAQQVELKSALMKALS